MINNIYSALEQLGLTAHKRALHIQFSNASLNAQLFLQRVEGQHALNQGLSATLICLSTNPFIALKQFIGSQVAVDSVTDQGTLSRMSGIITQADIGASDGALTIYRLTLEDPSSLFKQRRNSRVFMNKSVVDVVDLLFREWQDKSPLLAASLSLDHSGLTQDYDIRPFIMQAAESDFDFITRLLRSEGINWLIDEAELTVADASAQIQAQKLRLIDDNNQYSALARRNIRFHRSSASEQSDSITSLIGQRVLQPSAVHVQRWQADVLETEEGSGSVHSTHSQSEHFDNASLGLEQAWHFSPAWMQDLNGEDGATASGNHQIETLNQHLSHYYALQAKQFIANSTVRDTQVGYWFELNEHPEIDQHTGADKEFLITSKTFYNQNNLPKDVTEQVNQLLAQSHWQHQRQSSSTSIASITSQQSDERQGNCLTLQRRSIHTVPEYHPLQHRPAATPQRAKVVGPSGEEIHVDAWGRIKVRFLFTRSDDHAHDGGAGANDNDTDSAWVDVLTPWAGEGYGARFLPRVDEIVVIDFFDGNIDRPFVLGRIHEAQRSPTQFDAKGQLPETKKLAGIRSKEIGGAGYNQLRFDDSTGQISSQLQSSHAASQLNLGNLSHPKESQTSDGRGEGFELRTDQWGALRAGQGLLLSTYKQAQAQGQHLDAEVAKKQLEGSESHAKSLSDIAKNQHTDEIESVEQLKAFAQQIEQDMAKFKKAMLLLNSPEGIGLSTAEDIHLSADGQINHIAGDSINLSTQKNLIAHAQSKISLFAAQEGARLYAGKGKVEIQAQSDGADLIARKGIQIISTEDRIEITSPKEIVLTAGGSQLKINSSGIFPKTGGKFEVKAGQHVFTPGASISKSMQLPEAKPLKGALELLKSYGGQDFFKQTGFKVLDSLGKQVTGKLDGNGFAAITGIAPGPAKVEFEKDLRSAWDQGSHFVARDYTWTDQVVNSAAGFAQNALTSLGQNMMSQLKNNLFSLNGDSLKNIGKNALQDLGQQTFGQLKEQATNRALGGISSQLNLNLSPQQLMSVGQMVSNPNQSVKAIQEQGIDFFKDQASAMLQKGNSSSSMPVSNTFVDKNSPVVVTDNFIDQKYYQSSSLTYTETTRARSSKNTPVFQTASSSSTDANSSLQKAKITEKPIGTVPVNEHFISQSIYETRNLTIKETTREVSQDNNPALSARNTPK
ncbi:type VI secretion system protein [Acinetobacter harbinensis]|uniref:type VI secretion system Vgr family protein n=1 Tax=Acinetobacter harbinensis TaxID=1353941 RepID=UPI00057E4CF4|nr:type VI secretion system Vgr family protein [Acinetobacter harbinensis]KWQ04797.1 type VI secretion system protein [Acinetobacter harbinensis]